MILSVVRRSLILLAVGLTAAPSKAQRDTTDIAHRPTPAVEQAGGAVRRPGRLARQVGGYFVRFLAASAAGTVVVASSYELDAPPAAFFTAYPLATAGAAYLSGRALSGDASFTWALVGGVAGMVPGTVVLLLLPDREVDDIDGAILAAMEAMAGVGLLLAGPPIFAALGAGRSSFHAHYTPGHGPGASLRLRF